jgi:ABC-type sugar transport system substrate-binding protein
MLKHFTVSAVLAAVIAAAASAALAAPGQGQSTYINRAPTSGAEWWQDRGNADDMGSVYRR